MRRAALLLLLVAPLALAACGGGGGSKSSAGATALPTTTTAIGSTALSAAVAKTGQVAVHMSFSGSVMASGQSVHLGGTGDIDSKARRGTMRVQMALAGQQVPMNEVLDGTVVYVGSPFFSSFLPQGKKWLKVGLADAAKTFGPSAFALTSPQTVPSLLGVSKVGTATIDGVQTTQYEGRMDLSKLPAAAKAALNSGHVTFSPVDVWVGSDGYVHRTRITTSSSAGGQKATVVVTTTLSKFGEPVKVTVPPASETVDASKAGIPGFGKAGA